MGFRHPFPLGAARVSDNAIEGAFLEPGLEARAHNLRQYDPSPGTDSLLERIRALALRLPPSREREALIAETEAAILSNRDEGQAEVSIAAAADQLATDLGRIQRRGSATLSGQAIARHLREPLARIARPEGQPARELASARDRLRDVLDSVPRLMLLSDAVAHELGAQKFAVLWRLAQEIGPAQCVAAGAMEDRGGGQHGAA